jgi:hypothetical protein
MYNTDMLAHRKRKGVSPVAEYLSGIRLHPLLFEGDLILRVNRKG